MWASRIKAFYILPHFVANVKLFYGIFTKFSVQSLEFAKEESSEVVNDAVYKRNRDVEDYLGIDLEFVVWSAKTTATATARSTSRREPTRPRPKWRS